MAYKQNSPFSRNSYESPLNSFDSLVAKLEKEGKSHEAATKIAGSVANAKMHGAGSGPTAKQKARHGMSRESSELADMPIVDIEKGDAEGDDGKWTPKKEGEGSGKPSKDFVKPPRPPRKVERDGVSRMTGHGESKGDQSKTRSDYANFKDTDPGYHGHTGSSHGDQSATRRDYVDVKKIISNPK